MITKNLQIAADTVSSKVRAAMSDLILFLGAAAVVWGVHFWSVPAAWVTGGVLAILMAIYGME